jgi:hypothetical protein
MNKNPAYYSFRKTILLVIATALLFAYQSRYALGIKYYTLEIYANAPIQSPLIILANGSSNVSYTYINGTSAKISIDATSSVSSYNYSLNVINDGIESAEVRLEYCSFMNLNDANATLILHNETITMTQIEIQGGSITQYPDYFILASNSTIYIGVQNLVENAPGGYTILQAYLRIKTLNTTTYTFYTITFEFT